MKRLRPSCQPLESRQLLSAASAFLPPPGNALYLNDLAGIPAFRSDRRSMRDLHQYIRDTARIIITMQRFVDSGATGADSQKIQRDEEQIIQASSGTANEPRIQQVLDDPSFNSISPTSPESTNPAQAELARLGVQASLINKLFGDRQTLIASMTRLSQRLQAVLHTDVNKLIADGARTGAVQPGSPMDNQLHFLATQPVNITAQP